MKILRKRINEWKTFALKLLSDPCLENREFYESRVIFYNDVLKVIDQAELENWEGEL